MLRKEVFLKFQPVEKKKVLYVWAFNEKQPFSGTKISLLSVSSTIPGSPWSPLTGRRGSL